MQLADLCRTFHDLEFPHATASAHPPRDRVRAVQDAVEQAVQDDTFLADCIEAELLRLDREGWRPGLAPFHRLPDLGIRFCLAYWAPGQVADPHEHTAWTVTAVCHNALEVATFDHAIASAEGRLVQKNLFPAPAGRAGHIYDPCIHAPRNPTGAWSMSFHVMSPRDGEPGEDGRPVLRPAVNPLAADHPFTRCAVARLRQRALRVLAAILAASSDPRAVALLEGIVARGDAGTGRLAADSLAGRDPAAAARARAANARAALTAGSRVASRGAALDLEVRVDDGAAELIADAPFGPRVLLRVSAWAAPALRVLAREPALVVGDLPGGLTAEEQIALIEALQEWGLFDLVTPVAPAPEGVAP
jgi:hypothetical protein